MKDKVLSEIRRWPMMLGGILALAAGVYFFKAPNGFATGGVSGISILLARLFPVLTQAQYMGLINILLLIIGVIVLGKGCGLRTIFCSLLFSGATRLLEILVPLSGPLTDQPFLELVYAVLLTGIGSAMLFYAGASSGGTDITALILKKYTRMNVGRALLITDFLIAGSTFFLFGIRAGLYSLLGLFAKAFLVDGIIESLQICKAFTIVTSRPAEIERYVLETLHRGCTAYSGTGSYSGTPRTVLMTVCPRPDAVRLQEAVSRIDPGAFTVVTNTSRIIGKGFRGV